LDQVDTGRGGGLDDGFCSTEASDNEASVSQQLHLHIYQYSPDDEMPNLEHDALTITTTFLSISTFFSFSSISTTSTI